MMHLVTNNNFEAKTTTSWAAIKPLEYKSEDNPYPIDAMPSSLKNAITQYQVYGQQPLPLVACSALANVSLACQGLANVARDKYLISPVSLYFLTIASSGERKSAVDSAFSCATQSWLESVNLELAPKVQSALSHHNAWKIERDAILSQLKRAAVSGCDTFEYKKSLELIDKQEPEIPCLPELYFEDTTQEALATHLALGWPSGSLWSDEAGIFLGSHSMQSNPTRFVALLNRLWDGKSTTAHRKTSQSFVIKDRRLTVNLMMQPILLDKMKPQEAGINRQSGFMARCLIAFPQSNMGHRFYNESPESIGFLDDYNRKIFNCLEQSKELTRKGCINLPNLSFSKQAKEKWVSYFNSIESGLARNSQWFAIKDFAAKGAENVARLAALFHLFEGKQGDINLENLEQSIAIVHWHLTETKSLLSTDDEKKSIVNARKLVNWIKNRGATVIEFREIQRLSPIRNKLSLQKAIEYLIENNIIREHLLSDKKLFEVNPDLLDC